MNRFEMGKPVLPNLKFLNKQEDAFEILEESQAENKNVAENNSNIKNVSYFIDCNKEDIIRFECLDCGTRF